MVLGEFIIDKTGENFNMKSVEVRAVVANAHLISVFYMLKFLGQM